ncbi:hypothetical protein SAMN05421841_3609 [Chryseobacterium wanjuense]|uniref:Uncharacterized protein n=1 Tax=Chryseobacterium wanjuense TaxID=356305 RepID=A0A1I0S0T6_9FLAO|nr:hypothetical protein SAMN05421841_3609 [Chryseobacterium wanjuense]
MINVMNVYGFSTVCNDFAVYYLSNRGLKKLILSQYKGAS